MFGLVCTFLIQDPGLFSSVLLAKQNEIARFKASTRIPGFPGFLGPSGREGWT